jgi:hypothetical protein
MPSRGECCNALFGPRAGVIRTNSGSKGRSLLL